jgi:hypothetical protein
MAMKNISGKPASAKNGEIASAWRNDGGMKMKYEKRHRNGVWRAYQQNGEKASGVIAKPSAKIVENQRVSEK